MNLFCFEVNLFLFRKFFFRSIKCLVSSIMRKENKYEKKMVVLKYIIQYNI